MRNKYSYSYGLMGKTNKTHLLRIYFYYFLNIC